MQYPLWATPERQRILEILRRNLFAGLCSFGRQDCPVVAKLRKAILDRIGLPDEDNPFVWIARAALVVDTVQKSLTGDELRHIPDWLANDLKEYWKADDRDARGYLWKLEKRKLHSLPGIYHRGNYDSIRKSEDLAKRPLWEIADIGISVFTMGRIAKVFIPGLKATIWVDLKGIKAPSQNAKRKWVRYGKGKAPQSIGEQIQDRCSQAVNRFIETPC